MGARRLDRLLKLGNNFWSQVTASDDPFTEVLPDDTAYITHAEMRLYGSTIGTLVNHRVSGQGWNEHKTFVTLLGISEHEVAAHAC